VRITARVMEAVKLSIGMPMAHTLAIQKVPVSHKVSEVTAVVLRDSVKNAYPNAKERVLEVLMKKFEELFANCQSVFMNKMSFTKYK
jgi:hypothetical protein